MDYLHISPSFVTRIPYLDVNKKHYIYFDMSINAMEPVNENERFVVKNGIK
jgi:hypothetical protein